LVDPDDLARLVQPELELRVGEQDSTLFRIGRGLAVEGQREVAEAARERTPRTMRHRLEGDVLVVPALGLRGGREDRLGQAVGPGKPLRPAVPADRAGLAVVLPARAGEVAPRDALERHDPTLPRENGAPREKVPMPSESL